MFPRHLYRSGLVFIVLALFWQSALAIHVGERRSAGYLAPAYSGLPIGFEVNQGQTSEQVRFFARGSGYAIFLTPSDVVFSLSKPACAAEPGLQVSYPLKRSDAACKANGKVAAKVPAHTPGIGEWGQGTSRAIADLVLPKITLLSEKNSILSTSKDSKAVPARAAVRMRLDGSNPNPAITGQGPRPGKVNYLRGNDPSKWRTGITTYTQVRYSQVYPGIDLVFYGNQRQLEHDFIVAPGADPSRIRLTFSGADALLLDSDGNLTIRTTIGEIALKKPLIFQDINGARKLIGGGYSLDGDQSVGFRLAEYDTHRALVIDPVLDYASYLGGAEWDYGTSMAVDRAGHVYVTGFTQSSDFPVLPGAFQEDPQISCTCPGGFGNAFVAKFSADGSELVYSTFLGGDFGRGYGIAVDDLGHAYVSGMPGEDFPVTPGAFQIEGTSFVAKLDAEGSDLLFSTRFGGYGWGPIALDHYGNVYLAGEADVGSEVSTTPGAFQPQPKGGGDCFVAKISADGTKLLYSTYLGGSDIDNTGVGGGIAVDSSGHAFVAGGTASPDFPVTPGAFQTVQQPSADPNFRAIDAFVSKLSADGSGLVYSTYLGGTGADGSSDIAIDEIGQAYVSGVSQSIDFPTTPATLQIDPPLGGFVTKLSADGSKLVYSSIGLPGGAIAVDKRGQAYVAGGTSSPNLPITPGAFQRELNGDKDAFLAKLNADGSGLLYATYIGGSVYQHNAIGTNFDEATGIVVDVSGRVYVLGVSNTLDFPTTPGSYQTALKDSGSSAFLGGDVFVAAFSGLPDSDFNFRFFKVEHLKLDRQHTTLSLDAHFTLGQGSDGIDTRAEKLTLKVGGLEITIPAGSFRAKGNGQFYFNGEIGQLWVRVGISQKGSNRFEFSATVKKADLIKMCSATPVGLTIGNDFGKTTAEIKVGANRNDYHGNCLGAAKKGASWNHRGL